MITPDEARPYYSGADVVHDFDHVVRVLRLALRIAAAEGADREIVQAAALLHDVGREQAERSGADHAEFAAARAHQILAKRCSEQTLAAIMHAIAAHRYRGALQPTTLEARVLFDADKLDAIGAVGVARAFAHGGAQGQRLWAPLNSVDVARWLAQGDDPLPHTPVHEFILKLQHLKERLYTATGRVIAEERHAYMCAFFQRFDAEVRGER